MRKTGENFFFHRRDYIDEWFLTRPPFCSHNANTVSGRLYVELVRGEERVKLQPGQPAPVFDLPDADLNIVTLEEFRNRRHVVLYFYQRDDTPGCTRQAIEFSELEDEFLSLDAVVLGVSMDDCMSHGAFRDKHGLSVQLLADPDGEVCQRYGVLQEREMDGRKKTGIVRSTFVIDSGGCIRHALYGISPRDHAAEVLELIRGLPKCR
jgi:peroxiredoxin